MNDYSWNLDYLAHHGVMGMKWGVRRYQNEDGSLTAKGYSHRLNYLDKQKAKYSSLAERKDAAGDSRFDKAAKRYQESVKTVTKIDKNGKPYQDFKKKSGIEKDFDNWRSGRQSRKADKAYAKAREYERKADDIQKEIDKTINDAMYAGYSVYAKDANRIVKTGRTAVMSILGTPVAGYIYSKTSTGASEEGTKYKVK